MNLEELKRLHADFPEINMSNFDVDDVAALNGWGIEIALMLPAVLAKLEAAQRLRDAVEGHRIWRTSQSKVAVVDAGLYSALAAFDKEQQ